MSLPGCPSAETLPLTAQTWVDDLWVAKAWDRQQDEQRLAATFRVLRSHCERWPTLRQFLDVLPRREPQQALEHKFTEEQLEDGRRRVREILNTLQTKGVRT